MGENKNPLSSGRQWPKERGCQGVKRFLSIQLIREGRTPSYPESEEEDKQGAAADRNVHRPAGEFKRCGDGKFAGTRPAAGIGSGINGSFSPVIGGHLIGEAETFRIG